MFSYRGRYSGDKGSETHKSQNRKNNHLKIS